MQYVNRRGSALNYVSWTTGSHVYCASLNSPGDASRSIEDYKIAIEGEMSAEGKLQIAKQWASEKWRIAIPVIETDAGRVNVGDIEGDFWTYTVQRGALSGIRMAMAGAKNGEPVPIIVRPVADQAEFDATGGAVLIVETVDDYPDEEQG